MKCQCVLAFIRYVFFRFYVCAEILRININIEPQYSKEKKSSEYDEDVVVKCVIF